MEKFCIITNQFKDENNTVTKRVLNYLIKEHKVVYTKENDGIQVEDDVECIIVLGGDGTLLKAARDNRKSGIPLMGINLGTLGYLSSVEKENTEEALSMLLKGNYQIETRMMIAGIVTFKNETKRGEIHALNDIVISRGGISHIVSFRIFINGQYLNTYHADGVIVSTPTGSTSYNLSAGGPIVEPNARLLMLTPICPHTLNTRSIVFSAKDKITIRVDEGKKEEIQSAVVNFDGEEAIVLEAGDEIMIRESELTTKIMKLDDISFLGTLHKKMAE
jgi:NAD+ kinase